MSTPPPRVPDPLPCSPVTEPTQRHSPGPSAPTTETALSLGLVGLGLVLFGAALHANWNFVHDDALIALRYTRNWLAGDGLVWNPGEYVEGYSSFLMVVLTGAISAFSGLDLVVSARLLNGFSVIATAALLAWALGARASAARPVLAPALAALLVLASPALAIWVCGALEGPLHAFVCLAGVVAVLGALEHPGDGRRAAWAGSCVALPALVRPDGLFFLAVAGLFMLWTARKGGARAWRGVGWFTLAAAVPLAGHLAFRLAYYGSPVPNTVLAKATGLPASLTSQGWSYVASWFLDFPFLGLVALGLLFVRWRAARGTGAVFVAAVIGGQALMIGFVGGDFMPAHRLLLPLVPICAFAIGADLALRMSAWPPDRRFVLAACVLIAVGLAAVPRILSPEPPDPAAYSGTIIGHHVVGKWPDGTLIATNNGGSLPYYAADYRFIDMLGLNDPVIARRVVEAPRSRWQLLPGHAKGDGAYVLGRDPDVIILGPAEGTSAEQPWFLSDFELADLPAFRNGYVLRRETIDVRDRPLHQRFPSTRSGTLPFVYYERRDERRNERRNERSQR